jgi:hypothetical protein
MDLLYRNKNHPYKIRLANYITVLFTFCIDFFIERSEADLVLLTVQNLKQFFLNLYLVSEVERKSIR